MRRKREKSYVEKIGKIRWEYNTKLEDWKGKLVGNKTECQRDLRSTILILFRDLLKAHAEGLRGCPSEYVNKAKGSIIKGCNLWAKEILSIADKCDYCLQDSFRLSEKQQVDEISVIKKQEEALSEIMEWFKNKLYTLWW